MESSLCLTSFFHIKLLHSKMYLLIDVLKRNYELLISTTVKKYTSQASYILYIIRDNSVRSFFQKLEYILPKSLKTCSFFEHLHKISCSNLKTSTDFEKKLIHLTIIKRR